MKLRAALAISLVINLALIALLIPHYAQDKIFISYAREDRNRAIAIAQFIRSTGGQPWMDIDLNAGDRWATAIEQELRDSHMVVLIWTPHSADSQAVDLEIQLAEAANLPIVPIVFDNESLPERLNQYHAIQDSETP